jgi:putative holliday junction resolvase
VRRALGLDVGDRRVGVALSGPLGITAQPLSVLQRGTPQEDLAAIEALVQAHDVERLIIGWPVEMSGKVGRQAKRVAAYAEPIAAALSLPLERVDERLTSVQAERALRAGGLNGRQQRQVVDKIAAALILQSWLDTRSQP